jgi:hypothetical protein
MEIIEEFKNLEEQYAQAYFYAVNNKQTEAGQELQAKIDKFTQKAQKITAEMGEAHGNNEARKELRKSILWHIAINSSDYNIVERLDLDPEVTGETLHDDFLDILKYHEQVIERDQQQEAA